MDVQLRASDDDRHRVIAELQRHTAAGRLTLDEFSDRVAAVWAARTLGELADLTRDLPAPPAPVGAGDATAHGRRELLVLFAVAAATLLLLGAFMALSR